MHVAQLGGWRRDFVGFVAVVDDFRYDLAQRRHFGGEFWTVQIYIGLLDVVGSEMCGSFRYHYIWLVYSLKKDDVAGIFQQIKGLRWFVPSCCIHLGDLCA